MKRGTIIILVALAAIVITAFSSAYTVHQTQQALVLQFGEPKRVVTEPGLKFKIPFVQNVVKIEKRLLAYDGAAEEIIAADQKRLVVDTFTRFKIVDPLKFFQTVNSVEGARGRLGPIVNSSLRQVLGSVPLSSVLTEERSLLMQKITASVTARSLAFGIAIIDVRIKRADLPDANSQAVYNRMKSERDREAQEFRAQGAEVSLRIRSAADREKTVLLAEAEKISQILRGQGDGEKNRVFAEAFGRDPEFFSFYRAMLAYEKALGSEQTTMVLTPNSEFFRYFGDLTGNVRGRTIRERNEAPN